MAKKERASIGHNDLFRSDTLKEHARRESQKFPPVGEAELRRLKQIWRSSERQARQEDKPFIPAEPDPGMQPDGIRHRATRAYLPHPEDPEATRRSQNYWTRHRKCAACPGPNRRQAKYPFGGGPNIGHDHDGQPT